MDKVSSILLNTVHVYCICCISAPLILALLDYVRVINFCMYVCMYAVNEAEWQRIHPEEPKKLVKNYLRYDMHK